MPGYPFVVVPHPFGSLDEAAVRSRAEAALARIERLFGRIERAMKRTKAGVGTAIAVRL